MKRPHTSPPFSAIRQVVLKISLAGLFAALAHAQGDLTPLDDPLTPLLEIKPRDEADKDRLYAYAKFTEGRLQFRRGELNKALKTFQRSFRYEPSSAETLNQIVQLSFALSVSRDADRIPEAARYADLSPEAKLDPLLFHRLAVEWSERGEPQKALRLYDRSLELRGDRKDSDLVLLHFELGRLRFLTEEYEKSAASFEVVQDSLENPEKYKLPPRMRRAMLKQPDVTWALMAEAYLEAGRVDRAEELFRRANKAKERPALFAFHLARVAEKRGDKQEALAKLQEYFDAKSSIGVAEPYRLLEELIVNDDDNADQQNAFTERLQQLWQQDSENPTLGFFLASRLHGQGNSDAAAEIFEKLLPKAQSATALSDAFNVYYKLGSDKQMALIGGRAVASLGSTAVLDPTKSVLLQDEERLRSFLNICREQKSEPGVAMMAALLATEAEEFETAEELFEIALEQAKGEKLPILSTWGLEFFMADQYAKASSIFQSAIDLSKDDLKKSLMYYYLSSSLAMEDHFDQALEAAKKCAELNDRDPQFATRPAWVLYDAKRYDEAKTAYQEYLEKWGDNYQTVELREAIRDARMMLSNVLVMKQEFLAAEEELEQVLDEFPKNIGAMNDLGYLWADQGKKLNRSLQMIQQAVEAEPDNEAYRDSLGWAYYKLGQYDNAIAELQHAITTDSPDAVILDHLGDALDAAGRTDEAVQQWKQAIEGFKKNEDHEQLNKTEQKVQRAEAKRTES